MNKIVMDRVLLFERLGEILREFLACLQEEKDSVPHLLNPDQHFFYECIQKAELENPWFSREFILRMLTNWAELLEKGELLNWVSSYNFPLSTGGTPHRIGLILAGNIPLVGFHDVLAVLISGNIAVTRLSSKDRNLYKGIRRFLISDDPEMKSNWVLLEEEYLNNIDAVIATGSDNSSRYFEYYFSKYPHIIRKNRNSVGILDGKENRNDIAQLGEDIFLYFGLGCRNVSKIYVPEGFRPDFFYENIETFSYLYNHNKYANNYDYQKAILLLNKIRIYDNGFLVLKKDPSLSSQVGVLHFEEYRSVNELAMHLNEGKDSIQCAASREAFFPGSVAFGMTQKPGLDEYADNIDTLKFLINL